MTKYWSALLCGLLTIPLVAQEVDEAKFIQSMYNTALDQQLGYQLLANLSEEVGPRLAGSPGDAKAVAWAVEVLDSLGFDTVFVQPVDVRHWQRGIETAQLNHRGGKGRVKKDLKVTALGGSVGTPDRGLTAEVIEVIGRADFEAKKHLMKGKIVFFNEPMQPGLINTGSAYGRAGWQRWGGAILAGEQGAAGVIVRSLTHRFDDYPHTGSMSYKEGVTKIPAAGISTNDAEWLHKQLKATPEAKITLRLGCRDIGRATSYNVIAEWTGSTYPNEIALVGGHLDSWDLGRGTQDDGAGVAHSIHALWLLKNAGYQPQRTHRIVLFANEEFGLDGAREYVRVGLDSGKVHAIAIESDGGSGAPRGFSVHNIPGALDAIAPFEKQLGRYGVRDWAIGGSGADIGQIQDEGVLLIGYRPDSQHYFDYHHTAQDDMNSVHPRDLELGSASIAALLYLIDKYHISLASGLEDDTDGPDTSGGIRVQ